jgi:hypothetical protein
VLAVAFDQWVFGFISSKYFPCLSTFHFPDSLHLVLGIILGTWQHLLVSLHAARSSSGSRGTPHATWEGQVDRGGAVAAICLC